MRLGIGSYTYPWAVGIPGSLPGAPMNARGLLDAASALGVGVVQYCDNLPLTALPPGELDAFLREVEARRLTVEVGTRGLDAETLRANLRLAARLGAPFLRLVLDRAGDEPTPEEAVARLLPFRAEFLGAGVRLALENHDRFPARTLARMVARLGTEYAGICLDTVNSLGALEGPDVVIEALAPLTLNLHVKDFVLRRVAYQMGFVVEGRPAGAGMLDIPGLLARLRAAGSDPNAILELWTPPEAVLADTLAKERSWAAQSVASLRTLIAE